MFRSCSAKPRVHVAAAAPDVKALGHSIFASVSLTIGTNRTPIVLPPSLCGPRTREYGR
jgi:hypothetical protein